MKFINKHRNFRTKLKITISTPNYKYEYYNFCYICGRLDHHEIECEDSLNMKIVGGKAKQKYGPWMSTDSADFLLQYKGDPRKPATNTIARGGRSSDNEGYCLGEPVVQGGCKNWLSRDVQETNKRYTWKGKRLSQEVLVVG